MPTRVKICGITRGQDARAAAASGAAAIGLVFYAQSPRAVTIEQARGIVMDLPPFVGTVGLFVNAEPAWVREVLAAARIDLLQFHGDESPEYCAAFGCPYLKALRVRPGLDLAREAQRFAAAAGLLLDAYDPERFGGTGRRLDWQGLPGELGRPLVLAGGLTPENVGEAIRAVRPYAVDVSGGVESAPGIKDPGRIEAFVQGVRDADSD